VLVIVEHGDGHLLFQALLDPEAPRSGDVLEIDRPEGRLEGLDDPHDLVGVPGAEADRPGVDPGELLEEHRLPFHDGHRRLGADVAEAQDRGPVGDDGHEMPDGGEPAGQGGLVLDLETDFGHSRRIDAAERRDVVDLVTAADGDLPSLVRLQDLVADFEEHDVGIPMDGFDEPVQVGRAVRQDRDVPDHRFAAHMDRPDFSDVPPGLADVQKEAAQHSRQLDEAASEGSNDLVFPPHDDPPRRVWKFGFRRDRL